MLHFVPAFNGHYVIRLYIKQFLAIFIFCWQFEKIWKLQFFTIKL